MTTIFNSITKFATSKAVGHGLRNVVRVGVAYAMFLRWRQLAYRSLREHPLTGELNSPEVADDEGLEDAEPLLVDGVPQADRVEQRGVIRHTAFRRWACAQVKAVVGLPSWTVANELMVQKVVRDVLAEAGVRKSHWCHHMSMITAMVFIPNDADIEATRYLCSAENRERVEMQKGTHYRQRLAGCNPLKFTA